MSLFRYPGGKSKLKKNITFALKEIVNNVDLEYREPFFGGGSVGLNFLDNFSCKNLWINDKDPGIWSIWYSVINFPNDLIDKINSSISLSPDLFETLKNKLLSQSHIPSNKKDIVNTAYEKLLVHQMSYSGLGTKAGGPIGGKTQKSSKYKIDCRWSPSYLCDKISKIHLRLSNKNIKCTCEDFDPIIINGGNAIIYLDPPYYQKGNELYQFGFTWDDHKKLAKLLKESKHEWVLSYDSCQEIKELYAWANIEEIHDVNYTINGSNSKNELLITPKKYKGKKSFIGQ